METKATSDGIGYASKSDYEYEGTHYEADIKHGDKVTILNAGSIEEGNFGPQHYFKIKTRNGEKKAPFNQTSINILVEALGDESENWVNKEVNVLIKKTVIGGKKVMPAYFVTDGYYFDDFGDVVKDEAPQPRAASGGTSRPDYPEPTDQEIQTPF